MTRFHLTLAAALALACTIPACADKGAASGGADSAATPGAVTAGTPSPSAGEVTAREIAAYPLDMPTMQKWASATRGMVAGFEKDPAAAAAMGRPAENETPAQQIARMERSPLTMSVLRANGLTARDYVMITGSYLQAGMVGAAMSANPSAKLPDGQNMANVKFVQEHRVELERLLKNMSSDKE